MQRKAVRRIRLDSAPFLFIGGDVSGFSYAIGDI
jgi:hypothetical protein